VAYRNLRPEVKDRYMLYASLKYEITDYLNVSARGRLDNTYTEKEDKRYASTHGTFAKPLGRYAYSNETFRQKYADIMANLSKPFAGDFYANVNVGASTHGTFAKPLGRYAYSNETFRQKYADIMANLSKPFAGDFYANVNVGASFEEYDTKGRGYGGQLLLVPNLFAYDNVDPSTGVPSQAGGDNRKMNLGVFGSAEISWKSAVYLTLNVLDRRAADKRYAKVLNTCKNVLARGRVTDASKAEVVKHITRLEAHPEISMDRFEAIWSAEKFLASIDLN
jgi:disulfide oxidoreductase YuzD